MNKRMIKYLMVLILLMGSEKSSAQSTTAEFSREETVQIFEKLKDGEVCRKDRADILQAFMECNQSKPANSMMAEPVVFFGTVGLASVLAFILGQNYR
ncbi:MAG: hypothetical protein H0X02_12110 [Nitrosomonas sp.]|nr:hypothetical protein [Nitrosomonas sp.]